MSGPSPAVFFDAVNAYQKSAGLKAAVELGIFTAIADGATTPAALAAKCSVAERGARILCDSLTIWGFLTKSGEAYALTQDSAVFLNRHSPAYLGSAVGFLLAPELIAGFQNLADAVRKGGVASSELGTTAPEHPMWVTFARDMAPMTTMSSQAMAQIVNVAQAGSCRILDIAAGHGMFGIAMAKANPQAHVTAQDWPNVLEVAKENAQAAGVASRLTLLPGSAFDVDLGTGYDLVLITNFLHHFDAPTCTAFMKKVHAALKPGGRAVTLEFVPDDDRVNPPAAGGFSLMMLGSTPAGDAYTFREFDAMFRAAGFGSSEIHLLEGRFQSVIVTNY